MEIEIRAGFGAPDGELLALLDRLNRQPVRCQRRGEIVREMVRVRDELERRCVEAWRRNAAGNRAARDRLLACGSCAAPAFSLDVAHRIGQRQLDRWRR